MGGNALKTTLKERLDKVKYITIKDKVIHAISTAKLYHEIHIPFVLPEKETFGDLDIHCLAISSHSPLLPPAEFFTSHPELQSKEVLVMPKSKSLSFECDGFQVDLKVYDDVVEFENDKILMSCGGLNHMIGYALKVVGLKWNHKGLFLTLPMSLTPNGSQTEAFLMCSDSRDILQFLGFDFDAISRLTKDEEIFEVLISSIFIFKIDKVQEHLKYLSNKAPNDPKMRPSIRKFLVYIGSHLPSINVIYDEKEFESKILLDSRYPHLAGEVEEARRRAERLKIIRVKFNGSIVQEIVKLEKKSLGDFMNQYRGSFPSKTEFEDFIIASKDEEIKISIQSFFSSREHSIV